MSAATATLARTTAWLGVLAFLCEQLLHEACHGAVAILVGGRWAMFHLFAVETVLSPDASTFARLAVPASAALLNIVVGAGAVATLGRLRDGTLRTFAIYFASFNLLAGFGYLMFDAVFYSPAAENAGDWKRVIHLLGGTAMARWLVGGVGAAGYLGTFFRIPRWLISITSDPLPRRQSRFVLALVPYLAANGFATLLAPLHPLEGGLALVVTKGWMGFSGLFWSYFMMKRATPTLAAAHLGPAAPAWKLAAGLAMLGALGLAAAPIHFP